MTISVKTKKIFQTRYPPETSRKIPKYNVYGLVYILCSKHRSAFIFSSLLWLQILFQLLHYPPLHLSAKFRGLSGSEWPHDCKIYDICQTNQHSPVQIYPWENARPKARCNVYWPYIQFQLLHIFSVMLANYTLMLQYLWMAIYSHGIIIANKNQTRYLSKMLHSLKQYSTSNDRTCSSGLYIYPNAIVSCSWIQQKW